MQEESSPEGFKLLKEKLEYNAFVLQKDDVENPIFRIDLLVDKVTPKQMLEVLKDQSGMSSWFGKCVQSKFHSMHSQDGSEIFSTVYKGAYPLNNREVIHRRLIHCDDSRQLYMVNYTTTGLENVVSKSKSKYARAYHHLCGVVLRGGIFNERNEIVGTRLFYIN